MNPRPTKRNKEEIQKDKGKEVTEKQVTFTDFLQSYIKVSEIDYLFVNGRDGVEFYILNWLLQQKQKKGEGERMPICFVTIDLHGPLGEFGLDESSFDKLILNFLQQSDFIIVHGAVEKDSRANQRIFVVNAYEPFCVEKYFGHWCKPAGDS